MSETSLIPAEAPGGSLRPGYDPYPAGGHQVPTQVSPLKMLHLFLRGRYLILIFLAGILTTAGSLIGYRFGHTIYRSFGVIRVKPESQKILYTNENNGLIPMFNEFLEAETAVIGGERVLSQAMDDPDWKAWEPVLPNNLKGRVAEELEVTHQAEMLEVTVWDEDPKVSMLAVKTIIHAYNAVYNETTTDQQRLRDTVLMGRKEQLAADVAEKSKDILNLALKYGTDDLKSAYDQKFTELQSLEPQLMHMQEQLGFGYGRMPTATATPDLSEESIIAKSNDQMAQALKDRDQLERRIRLETTVGGLGEKNSTVMVDRGTLAMVNDDIKKYKTDYEKATIIQAPASPTDATINVGNIAAPTTRPQYQPRVEFDYMVLKTDVEKCKADLLALGKDKLNLDELKEEKSQKEDQLRETSTRLEQLQLEAQNNFTRLEVVTDGDQPARASDRKDTHTAMAALGGTSGFVLASLIVTVMGLRDRRLHGPEDTQMSSMRVPMLGMLPTLNSDLADPEQAAMAAHFVHGIRAMLQIKGTGDRGRVLAITSPSAHNGKTSLSLALGVSFAGAHSKTLLIDCDFIGRALSSRVNAVARPRLGRVLRHEGLIDEKNLQEGLDQALRKGKRLGEALIDMGCVSEEKMVAALDAQKKRSFGVLEAIDGEDLQECIAPTDIPGLSILPLGQANAEHIGSLSPAMIRQVLETTREQYDVVIVDTGPILGSLEAAMVATQADDVVVVLSAGENRGAAERSLRYLESVGAKVAGFVFNRATPRDFERSDNAQRVSSSADRWRHARGWSQSQTLASFGPVAQAVARSVGDIDPPNPKDTAVKATPRNGRNGKGGAAS